MSVVQGRGKRWSVIQGWEGHDHIVGKGINKRWLYSYTSHPIWSLFFWHYIFLSSLWMGIWTPKSHSFSAPPPFPPSYKRSYSQCACWCRVSSFLKGCQNGGTKRLFKWRNSVSSRRRRWKRRGRGKRRGWRWRWWRLDTEMTVSERKLVNQCVFCLW